MQKALLNWKKKYNSYKNFVVDSNAIIIPDDYIDFFDGGLTGR